MKGYKQLIFEQRVKIEEMYLSGELPAEISQAFGNCFFTDRERAFGNEILCELDRLQFATLGERTAAAKFLGKTGALMLDQLLAIFGFDPLGGEEGKRRVQTLNMANVKTIDQYQLGKNGEPVEPPPAEPPTEPAAGDE